MESRGVGLQWGGVSVFLRPILVNDSPNCILLRLWADRWTVLRSSLLGVLEQNHEVRKIWYIGAEERWSDTWYPALAESTDEIATPQKTHSCTAHTLLWGMAHINAAAAYSTVHIKITSRACHVYHTMVMHDAVWGHPLLLGMSRLEY